MAWLIPNNNRRRKSTVLGYEWLLYALLLTPLICALMLPVVAWWRR